MPTLVVQENVPLAPGTALPPQARGRGSSGRLPPFFRQAGGQPGPGAHLSSGPGIGQSGFPEPVPCCIGEHGEHQPLTDCL